jgi:diguanylate cyclase (GGDEF)-like protein
MMSGIDEIMEAGKIFFPLDHTTIGHFVLRDDYKVVFWNRTMESWTGISRQEIVGTDIFLSFPNLQEEKFASRLNRLFSGGPPIIFSAQLHKYIIPIKLPGNKYQIQQTTVNRIPVADSSAGSYIMFAVQDVTATTEALQSQKEAWAKVKKENEERKLVENALVGEREFLQNVIDSSQDLIQVFSLKLKTILTNKAAKEAGIDTSSLILCQNCRKTEEECVYGVCLLDRVVEKGETVRKVKEYNHPRDGKLYLDVSISPVTRYDGKIWAIVEDARDITARVNAEEKLRNQEAKFRKLAHQDALTSLPNRYLFLDRLDNAINRSRRNNKKIALFFLDLDRFKQINDSLGHDCGDELLKITATRLLGSLRAVDTVARLGGDEFVAIIEDVEEPRDISMVCNKLISALTVETSLKGHEISVSTSIGVAVFPDDADNAEELLKCADTAMYRAKKQGRNACQFFTKKMSADSVDRLIIENELRKAIDGKKDFELYYQPKIILQSGKLFGMEALVRWHHPQNGLVPPGKFIPVAEESGLIISLGANILHNACVQRRKWFDLGIEKFPVAVNLSPRQFRDQNLLSMLERCLADTGLAPELLVLEVTEESLMEDTKLNIEVLEDICNLGVCLAIDDFGTGYSSFGYLKKFPISILKIDRSFINGITNDKNDIAIVSSIISLGHHMNLSIVAEGIETREQQLFLAKQGCQIGQGYLFDRPLPADDFEKRYFPEC